ncbi:MAG: glycoside hydrolase family 2 TIM barrel-domain containing protein [Pirellulaceae bacterium]
MMVWQVHASGGKNPPWTRMKPSPTDADWPDEQHQQFMLELERMVDTLENHPSIVVWVPFNEAWGQHRTMEVGKWMSERDSSRLVNIASGGNFWPIGDIADHHSYPHPNFPFDAERYDDYIKVVGEFGGHGFPVTGHLWDAQRENWGYGGLPKTKAEYRDRYIQSLEILERSASMRLAFTRRQPMSKVRSMD